MKHTTKFGLIVVLLLNYTIANACEINTINSKQKHVIAVIDNAENYIKKYGVEKAVAEFRKNSNDIFMADYNGVFYVSPLHPELIGSSQLHYRDPSGVLAVQQEIDKAKAGGGWLKGRLRQDAKGNDVCRKIYVRPVSGNYLIGSWYHYAPSKQKIC